MSILQYLFYLIGGFFALLVLSYSAFRIAVQRGGRKVETFDPATWIIWPGLEVEVGRNSKAAFHICWNLSTPWVKIYARTDPVETQPGLFLKKVESSNETTINDIDPGQRKYFTIESCRGEIHESAERMLPIKSVVNLRDLGGYQTFMGQRVGWGRVYRSGDLSRLSNEDSNFLKNLGIRVIFDLRNSQEVETQPNILPKGIRYLHHPVYEDEFPRRIMPVMLFNRHKLGETLGNSYLDWLEIGAVAYGQLFDTLSDSKNYPILFHCSAGKDRAGIAAAILLSLLDVPDKTIIADYSLTNLAFNRLFTNFKEEKQLDRLRIPVDDARIMFAANPAWIRSTLDYLKARYHGAEGYLLNRLNISREQIISIRSNLLVK